MIGHDLEADVDAGRVVHQVDVTDGERRTVPPKQLLQTGDGFAFVEVGTIQTDHLVSVAAEETGMVTDEHRGQERRHQGR